MVPVFIIKWIDYSKYALSLIFSSVITNVSCYSKYGFGFEMSDGTVGVLFNDNTKIAANADRWKYIVGSGHKPLLPPPI